MKKFFILAFIAIFITGSMTKAVAQTSTTGRKILHSGQVLKVENSKKLPVQANLMKTDMLSGSNTFWAVAQSYYNSQYNYFSFNEISEVDYCTQVTIDGDKATFSNIVDNSNYYGWKGCNPVTGKYDAEKGTITIDTPTISDDKTRSDYTELGEMEYYGNQIYVVLLSGDFSTVPNEKGVYPLYMEDKLIFDVSEDGTTLTPRNGYGAFAMYVSDNSYSENAGYMTFYKTSTIKKMKNEPDISINPETLDLTGENIFVGTPINKDFKLKNMGLTDAKYTITTSTDELQVQGSNQMPAGSIQNMTLTFTAKNDGPFNGTVTFTDQNGNSTTMTVKADVKEAYDYSSVIKNGDLKITHYNASTSAAEITSDITGFPVLVTTNTGDGSVCGVNVNINVPDGQVATFSWKGQANGQYPNQALILMNDQYINDRWEINDYNNEHDLSDKIILKSGTYDIIFGYYTAMDWYSVGTSDTPLRAYYYDFDLTLYPESENNVDVYTNTVQFATAYYDNLAKTDTLNVKLYNLGSKPLTITSVENDGPFSAVNEGLEIAPYETGNAKITFTRTGVGEYTGDVVLNTTGGDVTIHCNATTEKIIYDYSPIVLEGNFSFDTSKDYPWLLDGNKAYSPTSGMTIGDGALDSWLEASFVVPEGNTGTVTWSGRNSSAPFWNFMDDLIFTDGTIIYVDGIEVTKFAGTLTAGSDQLEQPLVFSAGQHNVRFLYRKLSSEPEGEDRYVLYNLALELTPTTGINNTVENGKTVKNVEYYTISGERISAPIKGINIIKSIYDDGTNDIKKIILK